MVIELTEQQGQLVRQSQGQPVEVIDPQTRQTYLLVRQEHFAAMHGSPPAAPPEEEPQILPGIRRSMEAYWRDLPQLLPLASAKRRWVAYHGDERVGFARTETELYQECFRRGLTDAEVYIDMLQPREQAPWETMEIEATLWEMDDEQDSDAGNP